MDRLTLTAETRRWIVAGLALVELACASGGGSASVRAPASTWPRDVQVGIGHGCVIEAGGVGCWGAERWTDGVGIGLRGVPGPVRALRVGVGWSCALLEAGEVWCWDEQNDGQAEQVPGLADAVDLAVEMSRACAVHADGRVSCWWVNEGVPEEVRGVSGAVEVESGQSASCARLSDGGVACWTRLGGPAQRLRRAKGVVDLAIGWSVWIVQADGVVRECRGGSCSRPYRGIADAVEIGTSGSHTCARRADGRVSCWSRGGPLFSAMHPGWDKDYRTRGPVDIPGIDDARALAVGEYLACVDEADDGLRCWGRNESFQLGDAAGGDVLTLPTQVEGVKDAETVRVGPSHTCAIDRRGELWCWGVGDSFSREGERRRPDQRLGPTMVRTGVRRVLPGNGLTCAQLEPTGSLRCWGSMLYYFSGARLVSEDNVSSAPTGAAVDLSGLWGCATNSSGLSCFGAAGYQPSETVSWSNDVVWTRPRTWSVEDPRGEAPVEVAIGAAHGCMASAKGQVSCWGGDGVSVVEAPPLRQLTASVSGTCGLDPEGRAWCWGWGNSRPRQAAGDLPLDDLPPLTTVRAGAGHLCGLDLEGGVWCGGNNGSGELGRGSRSPIALADRVPGIDRVVDLDVHNLTTCAVDALGQVWCWGGNGNGQASSGSPSMSAQALRVAPARVMTVRRPSTP